MFHFYKLQIALMINFLMYKYLSYFLGEKVWSILRSCMEKYSHFLWKIFYIAPLKLSYIIMNFFLWYLGLTQGFALPRQVLYPWSQNSSPFSSVYFGGRLSLFASATWTMILLFMPPITAGITAVYHHTSFFCWDGGLANFLPLILLISFSQLARITDLSHQHPVSY
jgi:hypothetical protein